MIRINLLPHREEKRKARQKQFITLTVFTSIVALLIGGLLWFIFDSQVDNQKGRNKYLIDETAKVDKQIDEIKKIREETASLLAKKQVVEGLQVNRSEPVYLLDQLLALRMALTDDEMQLRSGDVGNAGMTNAVFQISLAG